MEESRFRFRIKDFIRPVTLRNTMETANMLGRIPITLVAKAILWWARDCMLVCNLLQPIQLISSPNKLFKTLY